MRICFYGAPCSGKSTTAAWAFAEMKLHNYNVELVSEYIKFWTYIQRIPKSFDQIYILAKQIHKEENILLGGAEHIITDSPLLLACFYAKNNNLSFAQDLINIVTKFEKEYPAIHIFLKPKAIYSNVGRYHSQEESLKIYHSMKQFVQEELAKMSVFVEKKLNLIDASCENADERNKILNKILLEVNT